MTTPRSNSIWCWAIPKCRPASDKRRAVGSALSPRTGRRRRSKAAPAAPRWNNMSAKVAIIGRPNVGKSTLFNRLVGRRLALVDDLPGVTRDRREGDAKLGDLAFTAIDTAGLEDAERDSLSARMQG